MKIIKSSKQMIQGNEEREYSVLVNFASFVGVENEYGPYYATDEDDARYQALEDARDDLSVENIEQIDDDEYEVEVNFATFVGANEFYTVYADSEEEAEERALEEAFDDLSAEVIEEDDDEE